LKVLANLWGLLARRESGLIDRSESRTRFFRYLNSLRGQCESTWQAQSSGVGDIVKLYSGGILMSGPSDERECLYQSFKSITCSRNSIFDRHARGSYWRYKADGSGQARYFKLPSVRKFDIHGATIEGFESLCRRPSLAETLRYDPAPEREGVIAV